MGTCELRRCRHFRIWSGTLPLRLRVKDSSCFEDGDRRSSAKTGAVFTGGRSLTPGTLGRVRGGPGGSRTLQDRALSIMAGVSAFLDLPGESLGGIVTRWHCFHG